VEAIIARAIAILIINLIGPDNLQLSIDCAFFTALASFCSRGICLQLCEADAFNVVSTALLSSEALFNECGQECLSALYNCLVEWPLKTADALESAPFQEVLKRTIDAGKAKVKQSAVDIVCFLIANVRSDSKVIECAGKFNLYEHIPLFIELGLRDTIPYVLAAASKIITALAVNPQKVDAARAQMITEDVVDALTAFLENPGHPLAHEYAQTYLNWARGPHPSRHKG
jgi:hypothetical protein